VQESVLTAQQLDVIEKEKLIKVEYPTFAGFQLKTIYDFFMLFVVLCGLAGLVLYALSPILKKMMHGVR
jgi:POT family proton-dependent oligopeptide transporter